MSRRRCSLEHVRGGTTTPEVHRGSRKFVGTSDGLSARFPPACLAQSLLETSTARKEYQLYIDELKFKPSISLKLMHDCVGHSAVLPSHRPSKAWMRPSRSSSDPTITTPIADLLPCPAPPLAFTSVPIGCGPHLYRRPYRCGRYCPKRAGDSLLGIRTCQAQP